MLLLLGSFPLSWKRNDQRCQYSVFYRSSIGCTFTRFRVLGVPLRALDGQGRYLVINMLDSRVECRNIWTRTHGTVITTGELKIQGLGERVQCDPLVYIQDIRRRCRVLEPEETMRFKLESRSRVTEWIGVVDVANICSPFCQFNWLGRFTCEEKTP